MDFTTASLQINGVGGAAGTGGLGEGFNTQSETSAPDGGIFVSVMDGTITALRSSTPSWVSATPA